MFEFFIAVVIFCSPVTSFCDAFAVTDKVYDKQNECVVAAQKMEQAVAAAGQVPVMTFCIPMKVQRT
jgi:hypothetical protein